MTHTPEMPADCPQVADLLPTHGPSYYLTLRPRSYAEAVRDVSRYRDLPDYVFEELHRQRRHTAEVVCLAQVRAELAVRRRK
jgi:hypothetical protein